MYAHVSPTFGAPYASNSNDNLMNNPNQLMRSKSLNDISNDPQLQLAFAAAAASGRPGGDVEANNQQHINNHNSACNNNFLGPNLMVSYNNTTQNIAPTSQQNNQRNCLTSNNIESILQPHTNLNQSSNFTGPFNTNTGAYQSVRPFVGGFDNQCSSNNINNFSNNINSNNNKSPNSSMMVPTIPASNSSSSNATTATNMFNTCNPLATNLNGVTEQIGNLHL